MTQKLWLKKLKLIYSKNVIDIVQFGSSVVENEESGERPNDIDIAVIFNKIALKDQLNESQKIKKQLQKICEIPIHIKSFDLYSLFEISNFSKNSVLFGKSLISGDFFSKRFGLNPRIQIYYSLNNLLKKDKIRFNYMLNGKKGIYGLLRKYKGELLKPGLIKIFPEHKEIFINSIKKFKVNFNIEEVMLVEG